MGFIVREEVWDARGQDLVRYFARVPLDDDKGPEVEVYANGYVVDANELRRRGMLEVGLRLQAKRAAGHEHRDLTPLEQRCLDLAECVS